MLVDSGARREFESGAVRDIAEGKGRCDLLPLDTLGFILRDSTFDRINQYVRTGDVCFLKSAILNFCEYAFQDIWTGLLEVSKQYEDGAKKYSDRNWEKGMPLHCFIDSGVRHLLKFHRGDKDEPHDRAFVWNILGAIWMHENHPELIDLPFKEKTKEIEMPEWSKHPEWFTHSSQFVTGGLVTIDAKSSSATV